MVYGFWGLGLRFRVEGSGLIVKLSQAPQPGWQRRGARGGRGGGGRQGWGGGGAGGREGWQGGRGAC